MCVSAEMQSASAKSSFHNTLYIGRTFHTQKKPTLLKILAKSICNDDARSPFLLQQHNSGSFTKIIELVS